MEEEKYKFIIPVHERRQPGTITIDPTQTRTRTQTQYTTITSPVEAPRQHPDNSYSQTAQPRDVPDSSPPYPESRRISTDASALPIAQTYALAAPTPAAAAAVASAASPDRQGAMAGWMRKLENAGQVEGEPRKTILGLTIFRFWVAITLGIVIIGVAIAIGLGLGLANRTTGSTTDPTPPTTTQILGVPSPAPLNPYCTGSRSSFWHPDNASVTPYDASGSPIRFNNDQVMSFNVLCNTFWPQRQGLNPALRDILVMTVPDMLSCMTLCAQYNQGYSDAVGDDVYVGGGICVGVALIKGTGQFCYLKNATGINNTAAAGGFEVDSAVLVGDWANLTSVQQTLAFGGNVEVGSNATTAG